MKQAGRLINFLPVCFCRSELVKLTYKKFAEFQYFKRHQKSQAHIGIIEIQMKLFGYLFYMINDIVAVHAEFVCNIG